MKAMVLAAGFGTRMQPLTDDRPKPMIPVGGHSIIDRILSRLEKAGVEEAVVNLHYRAEILQAYLEERSQSPKILFSDESDEILGTGGGIFKALPLLGDEPFLLVNGDEVWLEGAAPLFDRMKTAWDPERMDALLAVFPLVDASGIDYILGDFDMNQEGHLTFRQEQHIAPYGNMGIYILHPRLFDTAPEGFFNILRLFKEAEAAKRLFGLRHEGTWYHVGTPKALTDCEKAMAQELGVRPEDLAKIDW